MRSSVGFNSNGGPDRPIRGKDAVFERMQNLRAGDIIEIGGGTEYRVVTKAAGEDGWVHTARAATSPWADDGPASMTYHVSELGKRHSSVDNPTYPVTAIVGRSHIRKLYRELV